MNHRLAIPIAVFAALVLEPISAHPATSSFRQGVNGYTGTVDTYVRMDQPTNRFESAAVVLVDNDTPSAHGLIRFDNIFGTGPGQVQPNALIESARLTFRTSNNGDPVWFHRMLVPWNETNNWNELSTSGPGLQSDNSEMSAVPDFTFTPSTPVPRVDTFDVTATVRGWLAGDFPNYGWGITNQSTDGWQFDSSENTSVTNRPLLEIIWLPDEPVPRIVRHPESSTNAEGSTVVLTVSITGTDPSYQWFKDGMPLSGATNATYVIPEVRRADAGSYWVFISNAMGHTTSNPAILTVIPDDTPPSLLCAYGTNNLVTIFVEFSEIVTNAADPTYYAVFPSDGGEYLTVTSAVNAGGGTQDSKVVLTLDPATPIVLGRSYLLNVGGVSDRFGNPVDPTLAISIALYSRSIFTLTHPEIWKFNDTGTDLGTAWRSGNYNDDSWPVGLPLFGFETAPLPVLLRTPLSRTNAAGFSIPTYYFRTHFHSFVSGAGLLRFRTIVDDAAAIYLNGAEILRIRLPAGPLDYTTQGTGAGVGDAVYEGPFTVCVSNLVLGDNVLAVEVHQTGPNSSDLAFGMELSTLSPDGPVNCFGRQPTNQAVYMGSPVTFVVEYLCPYSTVQWFKNGIPIPGATNLTYTIGITWPADRGNYSVIVNGLLSATAQLDVMTCCAPDLLAVYATNGVVVLQFDIETLAEWANFYVSAADDSHFVAFVSARYSSGTNYGTVLLLELDPDNPLRPDTPYNINLEGIQSRFGDFIQPQTRPIALFPRSLIRLGEAQQWRYDTSGTDLSNAWYRVDYDDTAWPVGLALFDARRPPRDQIYLQPVRTITTLSNAAGSAQIPTHYFRARFNHAGPQLHIVTIRPFVDDGAVYYLNGQEILRAGMPATPIIYSTLASRTVGDAGFEGPYCIAATNLVSGENVLAVEVHQRDLTSPDLTFGTEFGLLLTLPPLRLQVTLSADGSEVVLTWSGSAVLEQTSSLSPGGWNEVENAISGHAVPLIGSKFFRLRER